MQFQISARKWRPQTFEEVLGQGAVIQILKNAVSQGKTAQAYLFSGMRGVGKTTAARVLAKALNCADPAKRPCNTCVSCREITEDRSVDVMQIDGASNTSVDHVRELREIVKYLPLQGKHKIVIIDEVHMLSNAAFNALLKTLEEPPSHLVFIFATTEAHKIPATILSRCQQFIFRRISRTDIETHLKKVVGVMGTPISDPVLTFLAKASEGSLRDALSLLDQAVAYGGSVTEEIVATLFGRVTHAVFHRLIRGIHEKDGEQLLGVAKEIEEGGYDLRQFLADWIEYLRHLLVVRHVASPDALLDLPEEEKTEIKREAGLFSQEEIHRLFVLFVKLAEEIRNVPRPHIVFEAGLMRAILLADLTPIEKLIEQMGVLTSLDQTGREVTSLGAMAPSKPTEIKSVEVASSAVHKGFLKDGPSQIKPMEEISRASAVFPPNFLEENRPTAFSTPPQTDAREEEIWSKLMQEVKSKRPPLASYIEQGSSLEIQEKKIVIGFSEGADFLIPLIQKEEHRTWLQTLVKRYFNREMQILYRPLPHAEADKKDETAGIIRHPLVQEVLNVFEGAVVKI